MGTFERDRYPDNWDQLALACKDHAGWQCEHCQGKDGDTRIGVTYGRPYTIVISACHPNHDPENPDPVLLALCQACHLRLDGPQHAKTRKRRKSKQKYEQQRAAGQLELFSDTEEMEIWEIQTIEMGQLLPV